VLPAKRGTCIRRTIVIRRDRRVADDRFGDNGIGRVGRSERLDAGSGVLLPILEIGDDRNRVGCVGAPAFAVASIRGEVFVQLVPTRNRDGLRCQFAR
jgi:hypothetical protein